MIAHALAINDVPFDEPVGWVALVMTGLGVVVGPWILVLGVGRLRQGYRIFVNEPVGAGEAHLEDGVVEVEGTAKPLDEVLEGRYTDEPALAHSWRRERREERTDDEGNTRTSWDTVSSGDDAVPFLVEDATGEVAVDPTGATLSIAEARVRSAGLFGSRIRFGRRNEEYREFEGRIEPGDDVHVYGQMRSATDGDGPGGNRHCIGDGGEVSEFVVSDASEFRTVLRYFGQGLFLVVVAALWIPITTVVFLLLLERALGIPVGSGLLERLR
jgi:hypothetical protein